jgi:hypothetical protein
MSGLCLSVAERLSPLTNSRTYGQPTGTNTTYLHTYSIHTKAEPSIHGWIFSSFLASLNQLTGHAPCYCSERFPANLQNARHGKEPETIRQIGPTAVDLAPPLGSLGHRATAGCPEFRAPELKTTHSMPYIATDCPCTPQSDSSAWDITTQY